MEARCIDRSLHGSREERSFKRDRNGSFVSDTRDPTSGRCAYTRIDAYIHVYVHILLQIVKIKLKSTYIYINNRSYVECRIKMLR